ELPETELPSEVAKRLSVPASDLGSLKILRRSLDARNRYRLEFVYSLTLSVPDAEVPRFQHGEGIQVDSWTPPAFEDPEPGNERLTQRPVIVGSGPAGLLAGYFLALRGYRPLIIDRGQAVKE